MRRYIYLLGFIVCTALLGTVYYFQYAKHIPPCPLCIMQRFAYYLFGLTCLIAYIHNPQRIGQRIYLSFLFAFTVFGASNAARQVYLQHLPAGQAPACAPSLNFMLHNFPFSETLKVLFYGSGDCAIVHWSFLTLSMATWSLLFLLLFVIVSAWFLIKIFIRR